MRIVHELYLDADLPISELLTALHKLPLNSVFQFGGNGVSGYKLTFYSDTECGKMVSPAPVDTVGKYYRSQDSKKWDLS